MTHVCSFEFSVLRYYSMSMVCLWPLYNWIGRFQIPSDVPLQHWTPYCAALCLAPLRCNADWHYVGDQELVVRQRRVTSYCGGSSMLYASTKQREHWALPRLDVVRGHGVTCVGRSLTFVWGPLLPYRWGLRQSARWPMLISQYFKVAKRTVGDVVVSICCVNVLFFVWWSYNTNGLYFSVGFLS